MEARELLKQAVNGLEIVEAYKRKSILAYLKPEMPFSERLNDWINKWFEERRDLFKFVDEDDFDPEDIEGTLEKHKDRFYNKGIIHIWTGASDTTIFGEASINWKFRAWHDYIHITNSLGYDFLGESAVCEIQKAMLPEDWFLEKELIQCEIVGQALYFMKHEEFVKSQRSYTATYLYNHSLAINTKQK